MNNWISVKHLLPEKGQMCDCWQSNWGRKTDFEYEGDGTFYDNNYDRTLEVDNEIIHDSVTHWMAVPEPPLSSPLNESEELNNILP